MLLATDYKGDFLGFSFNKKHSSDFKIIRTSGGSRFDTTLLPVQKDVTVDIPGRDGTTFFNSTFQTETINVQFAFVEITEANLRELRNWLSTQKESSLIFDESPYKEYSAKVQAAPQFNFVPFVEKGQQIYKGEGSVQFQLYSPYAIAPYKSLDEYDDSSKWAEASGLPANRNNYDKFVNENALLYNPGDLPTPLKIFGINLKEASSDYISIKYQELRDSEFITTQQLVLDASKMPIDKYLEINSKIKLIQESTGSGGAPARMVYNNIIAAGDFISILPQKEVESHRLTITNIDKVNITVKNTFNIDYDYIYR